MIMVAQGKNSKEVDQNEQLLRYVGVCSLPNVETVKAPEVRTRTKGVGVCCPGCGKDAFVYFTKPADLPRTHPQFIAMRIRHYKCGTCEHLFKA